MYEESDVARLCERQSINYTKPVQCTKYLTFYLALIGFILLFFVGLLTGFLLRADTKVPPKCQNIIRQRKDGLDGFKLQSVHNNIMHFITTESVKGTLRVLESLSAEKPGTNQGNLAVADFVKENFKNYGLDHVAIKESEAVVTYHDAKTRLEIIFEEDTNRSTIDEADWQIQGYGFDQLTVSGSAQGHLVYGHIGRPVDLLRLTSANVTLRDSILLLQLGDVSVMDKVTRATEAGVSGLLLFCPHPGCYHGNFIDDIVRFGLKAEDWQPTIPVVAISNITSSKLATLAEGTSLFPEIWRDSAHGSKSQKVSVMMDLSTRREKLPTANVLGTLYGSEEPDLELLIGASLSTSSSNGLQSSPLDLVSIASLLELARTMSHVHHTQGWTPRRTVKFALWDRSSGMDTGLARYIQNNKHILGQEAVAYIDLDLAEDRDVRGLDSSVGLMDLLRIIADMVPDPVEPEFSLVEKWPSYFSQQSNRQPLGNYVINMANMSPLASTIGIPSISIQSLQILLSREANVNDPYISAITRVMSLVGVRIIDDIVLPYNLSAFVNFIDLRVRNTLTLADKSLPEEEFLKKNDNVLQALEKLLQAVNNLPAYDLCSVLTHLNNVKMKMESLFTDWRQTVVKGSTHTSVLSTVAEAVDLYKLTGNTDYYHKALSEITSRLSEAVKLIQTVPAS